MAEINREALYNELQARFESLKDAFERLDSEADASVVRWRYAEQSAFELRAEYFHRTNANPGKLVDDEPVGAPIYIAYGYDAQGRVIGSAFFQTEVNPSSYTYYEYGTEHVDFWNSLSK